MQLVAYSNTSMEKVNQNSPKAAKKAFEITTLAGQVNTN